MHAKRLFHLERPRLAGLRIDVIPIVKAKRHVAILLHLEHHDAAS